MYNEIYKEVLNIGRVMLKGIPVGYSEELDPKIAAVISSLLKIGNIGDRIVPYYISETNDTLIGIATISERSSGIIFDNYGMINGEWKHIIVINHDLGSISVKDISIELATLAVALVLGKVSAMPPIITTSDSSRILNLYAPMIIYLSVYTKLSLPDDNYKLACVQSMYSEETRDNITLATMASINTLLTQYSVKELLDEALITIIYANYSEPDYQKAYPHFIIDEPAKSQEPNSEGPDDMDIVPFILNTGVAHYHALAYKEGNLHDYIDDPSHYKIMYIRLDDDGTGDWATLEDKPVRVNYGGTVLLSSRCDLEPILQHDLENAYPIIGNYINCTDSTINSITQFPEQINALLEMAKGKFKPSFEELVTWVDILPGDEDNEAN